MRLKNLINIDFLKPVFQVWNQFVEFFPQTGPWYYFEIGPVCRNQQFKKKNNKTNNVGMMQCIKRASDMSQFPLVPRGPLGPLMFPSLAITNGFVI